MATQRSQERLSAPILDAEDLRDAIGHESGVGNGAELDQPDAVGIALEHFGSDLQGDPRLADAPDTEQRHEAASLEQSLDLLDLALAPHKRRNARRQVVGRRSSARRKD